MGTMPKYSAGGGAVINPVFLDQGSVAFLQCGEIHERKMHRTFDLVDSLASQKHHRTMGINLLGHDTGMRSRRSQ